MPHATWRMPSATRTGLTGLLWLAAWGCDVEWGGGDISLENPAPPPDSTVAETLEPEQIPLPEGPYLHLVRLESDGTARLVPLGEIADEGAAAPIVPTEIPGDDPTFRSRFDSAFLAPGTEFDLIARGGRLGSLILGESVPGPRACLSLASGQALLPPGQEVPVWAFAAPRGSLPAGALRRIPPLEPTSSMSVAGPVLAERLIGGDRAFLAQRVALAPVEIPGEPLAGMTATYLIADSLAAGPPGDRAVSLFFMARFEPNRGFIPIWEEVRRYSSPEDKQAFEYLDWIPFLGGRLDLLKSYDASSIRLAASLSMEGDDPEIVWIEPAGCEAFGRLETH